jgi:hypothetical protein
MQVALTGRVIVADGQSILPVAPLHDAWVAMLLVTKY